MKTLEKIYPATRYKTIREYINVAIKKFASKDAFILKYKENGKTTYKHIPYKEFGQEMKALGTGLIDIGLQGKRIAVIGNNSYDWVMTYIAVFCGVGTIVPLDKALTEEEIKVSLNRSKVDCVIFANDYCEIMSKIKSENTSIKHFICMQNTPSFTSLSSIKEQGKKLLQKGDKRFDNYKVNPYDVATIIFTSGTTDTSKAVQLSNYNIASNIYDMQCTEKILSIDTNLLFLPLHHTFGSTQMLLFFANGATTVFCDGLRHIADNLREYHVSTFVCVPLLLEAMYKKIWASIEKQKKTNLIKTALRISNLLLKLKIDIRRKLFKPILDQIGGELRFIISGAAAISKEVAKGFNDFGIVTVQGYGLTECSPVLTAENEKNIRYGSVGLPLPSVEIKIDNPNEDGIGEIIAKAPNVMLGYYEMPEETSEVLKDGWFYTGDLGFIDKDGFIYITGRKKNVIVLKNGKNVYPEEIEQLVAVLPYVSEVMVYGKPEDDDLTISAKIVYNTDYVKSHYPDADEDELKDIIWQDIKKINRQMPQYKYIKNLIIQDTPMQKTTTAKIKRYKEV